MRIGCANDNVLNSPLLTNDLIWTEMFPVPSSAEGATHCQCETRGTNFEVDIFFFYWRHNPLWGLYLI